MTRLPPSAYLAAFRARCAERGIDPRTGYPLDTECVYRLGDDGRRSLMRVRIVPDPEPELLCDPASVTWWQLALFWDDPGPAHSETEAAAIASIHAQARAVAPPKLTTLEAMGLIREVVTEMAAERLVQQVLPLRELHARRGVEVAEVLGIRMEVPIRKTA